MSIVGRVVIDLPGIEPPDFLDVEACASLLVDDFRRHTGQYQYAPLEFEDWNSRWPRGKQEIMRVARYAPLKFLKTAFTKAEFVKPFYPRNIVVSDASILAKMGPMTSALDHALRRHPAAVKGYDFEARDRKMAVLRNYPHFMNSDYSKFDRTISKKLLSVENEVYRQMCPAAYGPWMDDLLRVRWQRATSWRGVKYLMRPMRGTGDANTALGNWLLNRLVYLLLERMHPEMVVFIEGDDAICGFKAPMDTMKSHFLEIAKRLGFQARGTYTTDDLEIVPFCGRYLTLHGPPVSVPSIIGYLHKWHVSKRTTDTEEGRCQLLMAKTMSYLAMEPSTPVVPAIAEYVMRTLRPPRNMKFREPEYFKILKDNRWNFSDPESWRHKRKTPSDDQRRVVEKLGTPLHVQLAMEDYFDSLTTWVDGEHLSFQHFVPLDVLTLGVAPWPLPP